MEYFMRQTILGVVFCISLLFHTALADTGAIATNSDKPFKEKYAAIDVEIDGQLETLEAKYKNELDEEYRQHKKRLAQLYKDVPNVFDRSGQEKALHKKYSGRRKELQKEFDAKRREIYALRSTARNQLTMNNAVDVGVWNSVKTFDTTPIDRTGAAGSPTGSHVTGPAISSAEASASAETLGSNSTSQAGDRPGETFGSTEGAPRATDSAPQPSFAGASTDVPRFDQDKNSFTWADGTRVDAIGPDGSVGEVNDKGDIVFDDGTTLTHTGQGRTSIYKPDGSPALVTSTSNASSHSTGASLDRGSSGTQAGVDSPKYQDKDGSYSWSDGTSTAGMEESLQHGKVNEKGDIVLNDGTTIVHTGVGKVLVHEPDGSSREYVSDGLGGWTELDDDGGPVTGNSSGSGDNHSGQSSGQSGGSSEDDDSSGSSDSDTDNDNDDDSDSDKNGKGDSDADTETDTGSEDSDTGDDTEKGKSKESYGEGSSTYASGPNAQMQAIVDRATGNSTTPDSGVPEECGDSGIGGSVSQRGMGASDCILGGLPGISVEETEPETPDASDSVISEDQRRAAGASISDQISQPGLQDSGLPIGDLPSHTPLDQAPVTNPEPQN